MKYIYLLLLLSFNVNSAEMAKKVKHIPTNIVSALCNNTNEADDCLQVITQYLNDGGDVNAVELRTKQNMLMLAVRNKKINGEIIKLLIENGANWRLHFEGENVLTYVTKMGDFEAVVILVKSGVKIDLSNDEGQDSCLIAKNKLTDCMQNIDLEQQLEYKKIVDYFEVFILLSRVILVNPSGIVSEYLNDGLVGI